MSITHYKSRLKLWSIGCRTTTRLKMICKSQDVEKKRLKFFNSGVPKKKFCSSCNFLCTIACFSNIKKDTTFSARCYV
ncbi:unnamed protein product [Lactuca virosa]|uniref:Uncharacterized protein n=1 Tax=Lactuca virosa TaxID=75947 RepID=A0AAU9NBQ4_9ASTR|nr:unnamed protein product [Lactuca virosa]